MPTIKSRNLGKTQTVLTVENVNPPCYGTSSTTYGTRTVRRGTELYYDGPDQRPYPSNLLSSMTPRGALTRDVDDYLHWSRTTTYSVGAPCPPGTKRYKVEHFWHSAGLSTPPLIMGGNLDSRLNTAMRLKIKDARQNFADYVGEARETFDSFAKAGDKVVDTVRKVKKNAGTGKRFKRAPGKFFSIPKNWRKWLRKVPGTWLLSAFVLAPTIADAAEMYERAKTWETRSLIRRIVVTANDHAEVRTAGPFGGVCTGTGWISKRMTVYVRYSPEMGDFTAGNPLEAMWAGMPFTWVLDYFVSVGDWLSSLDAMNGVLSAVGTTTTQERRRWYDARRLESSAAVIQPGIRTYEKYQRVVVTSIPLGTPNWTPSGSWKRLVNLTAILASFHI